jgi:hypothetical protein
MQYICLKFWPFVWVIFQLPIEFDFGFYLYLAFLFKSFFTDSRSFTHSQADFCVFKHGLSIILLQEHLFKTSLLLLQVMSIIRSLLVKPILVDALLRTIEEDHDTTIV